MAAAASQGCPTTRIAVPTGRSDPEFPGSVARRPTCCLLPVSSSASTRTLEHVWVRVTTLPVVGGGPRRRRGRLSSPAPALAVTQ